MATARAKCAGINKRTGRIKKGYRSVKGGGCPQPTKKAPRAGGKTVVGRGRCGTIVKTMFSRGKRDGYKAAKAGKSTTSVVEQLTLPGLTGARGRRRRRRR